MSYYHRFKIVIGAPIFRIYLRWAYGRCIDDLKHLNFIQNFKKQNFTALLCGVGNENTADVFIRFVLDRSPKAKIFIIDLGKEQVAAVKKLVKDKYSGHQIFVKQMDALNLTAWISPKTVDWIETDWIFAFFSHEKLYSLLKVWHRLLSGDGFITTRCGVDQNWFDRLITKSIIWIGKIWLGVKLYPHSKVNLDNLITRSGLRFVSRPMILPTAFRYSMAKVGYRI